MVHVTSTKEAEPSREGDAGKKSDGKSKSKEHPDRLRKPVQIFGEVVQITGDEDTADMVTNTVDYMSSFPDLDGLANFIQALGQVHPAILVVATALNGILKVVQTAKENSRQVVLLMVTMDKMLRCLRVLKRPTATVPGNRREAPERINDAEDLLDGISKEISIAIRECGNVCYTYRNKHPFSRIAKVFSWRNKFQDVANKFKMLTEDLHKDLLIYITAHSRAAAQSLESIKSLMEQDKASMQKVETMVSAIFATHTPDEYKVYMKFEELGRSQTSNSQNAIELGAQMVAEDDQQFDGLPSPKGVSKITRTSFGLNCKENIERDIAESAKKLDALSGYVQELGDTTKRQHAQVMKALTAGPHERIVDSDVREIWLNMGWKGSVKCKNLVLALRDHFMEQSRIAMPRKEPHEQEDEDPSALHSQKDSWALQYLTILRVQPLLEALDDDSSSYVTISEINAFTEARPGDWSLPLWLAYWAYGSVMTAQWYFKRLHFALHQLWQASRSAHPLNRRLMSEFIDKWPVRFVEILLSGFSGTNQPDLDFDWFTDTRLMVFKQYVIDSEIKIAEVLRKLEYRIDNLEILEVIMGSSTPEKSLLPVVFVIMRHAVWVAQAAAKAAIDPCELDPVVESITIITRAILKRMEELKATWGVNSFEEKAQLKRYFFGLYQNLDVNGDDLKLAEYWKLPAPRLDYELLEADVHIGADIEQSTKESLRVPNYLETIGSSLSSDDDRNKCQDVVSTVRCDSCSTKNLSFFIRCLECSKSELFGTLDLCRDCYMKGVTLSGQHAGHRPHHTVIQIRMPVMFSQHAEIQKMVDGEFSMIPQAYRDLPSQEFVKEGDTEKDFPICHGCKAQIQTTPFWDCVDCYSQYTFYCQECGLKIDGDDSRSKPKDGGVAITGPMSASTDGIVSREDDLDDVETGGSTGQDSQVDLIDQHSEEAKVMQESGSHEETDEGSEENDDEHCWWHMLMSISPRPVEGPSEAPPPTITSLENNLRDLKQTLDTERQAAADHRIQFFTLVKLLKRFAPADFVAALEGEMLEKQSLQDERNVPEAEDLPSAIPSPITSSDKTVSSLAMDHDAELPSTPDNVAVQV